MKIQCHGIFTSFQAKYPKLVNQMDHLNDNERKSLRIDEIDILKVIGWNKAGWKESHLVPSFFFTKCIFLLPSVMRIKV